MVQDPPPPAPGTGTVCKSPTEASLVSEDGVERQEDGIWHHGGHAEVAEEVVLQICLAVGVGAVRAIAGDVTELVIPVLPRTEQRAHVI